MTVFMSPRTSYVLGRYGSHFIMSWFLTFGVLTGGAVMVLRPFSPTSLTLWGLTGLALSKTQGRRAVSRTVKESFYGTLGSFTGTCSSNHNDEIGGGGSHVEGD